MLYCKCGYTCGTQKAFERHLAKFANTPEVAALHGLDSGRERAQTLRVPEAVPLLDSGRERAQTLRVPEAVPLRPGSTYDRPRSSSRTTGMTFKTLPAGTLAAATQGLDIQFDSSPKGSSSPIGRPESTVGRSESTASLSSSMLLSPATPPSLRSASGSNSMGSLHAGSNSSEGTSPSKKSSILRRAGNSTINLSSTAPAGLGFGMTPTPSSSSRVRVLFVRHAQSANKGRRPGQRASADPDLTDKGYEQADCLAIKFARQVKPDDLKKGIVQVVSSPMRRCLLTIQPTVRKLKMPKENCLCHGSFYEYGCAGTTRATSSPADITYEFPEFQPVGFTPEGRWDYRGSNDKENEDDCRERCVRVAEWLHGEACPVLRARCVGREVPTLIFVTHQTVADLICQVLVDGTPSLWTYGDIRHRLTNAAVTEVFLHVDGRATFGTRNDDFHLK